MDLLITNLSTAINHIPNKPTYGIRIGDNEVLQKINLKSSSNYIEINSYTFADISPETHYNKRDILFSQGLAKTIIIDFLENKDNCEVLLVHCSRGLNRSPAIGIALNNIFNLGNNFDILKKKYSETNLYIYNIMIKEAKNHTHN